MLKNLLLETTDVLLVIGERFSIELDDLDELELKEYIRDLSGVDHEINELLLSIELAEENIGEELILLRSSLLDYISCLEDVKSMVKKLIEEMLKSDKSTC